MGDGWPGRAGWAVMAIGWGELSLETARRRLVTIGFPTGQGPFVRIRSSRSPGNEFYASRT